MMALQWTLLLLTMLKLAMTVDSFSPLIVATQYRTQLEATSIPNQQNSNNVVVTALVPTRYTREEGLALVDTSLFPAQQYGDRIREGRNAQGLDPSTVVNGDDPIMAFTYGEFPTQSTDQLIDLAMPHVVMHQSSPRLEMIDLGSGCGRLVCYFALTRGTPETPWAVHGIEISDLLHNVGVGALATGWDEQLFVVADDVESSSTMQQTNSLSLHMGPANEFKHVFGKAHLIFAYSTVFKTDGFSQELRAMILDREWSELLANSCQKGCVVVTTDRALDPRHGWELLDRLDVDNREVMGSTGYVQVLR
jgi:hypothetical protein